MPVERPREEGGQGRRETTLRLHVGSRPEVAHRVVGPAGRTKPREAQERVT